MKNLNEEIVKHIPVPDITKHEQQKITNMFDSKLSVCDRIEKNRYSFTGSRGSQAEYSETGF